MSASLKHKPGIAKQKTVQREQAQPKALGAMQNLILLENEALSAPDRLALKHQAVNHPRRLLDVGHIFWISRRGSTIKISALSSHSDVDRNSPFIQDISQILKTYAKSGQLNEAGAVDLGTHTLNDEVSDSKLKADNENVTPLNRRSTTDTNPFHYTFPHGFFAPFAPHPKTGGLLFTRAHKFEPAQALIMTRLAQSYGAIWAAMSAKPRDVISKRRKLCLLAGAGLGLLIGLIPVPVATLASAEIVADQPYIIAAPVDGVIENILIAPNSPVKAGTVLIHMVDTEFKSELQVATREEHVAEAELKQAALSSFVDEAAKRELAVTQAQTALARARTQYAADRFSKTKLTSPKDGLAIYTDPQDWAGRPVSTGEAIIEIANPDQVILKISAPLLAGEALESGARVRVFMDADPLNPLEAEIERASYYAAPTENGQMAYETYARISSPYALPRIGARGVAKIYGDTAPLIYWLLRRPIAAVRQFIGF